MLEATRRGDDRHRRRLDEGEHRRGRSRLDPLRRRPPDRRHGGARRRARLGGALRGRDLVPDADRPRPSPERYRARPRLRRPSSAPFPPRSTPAAHDRLVALTSHLPHVLANVVVNQAGATRVEGHEPLANAGGSLRDMTRIAGANPRMWVDVFLDNADAVRDGARRAPAPDRGGRGRARPRATASSSPRWIGEAAAQPPPHARRAPTATRARSSGCSVHVPDRPSVLAEITPGASAPRASTFATSSSTTSRPSSGGTLSLVVSGEDDADRIQRVLEGQGYGVVVSPVLDVDEG